MTALPNYTALIIGIVGVAMYQPQTLEVGLGRVSRTEAEMSGLLRVYRTQESVVSRSDPTSRRTPCQVLDSFLHVYADP